VVAAAAVPTMSVWGCWWTRSKCVMAKVKINELTERELLVLLNEKVEQLHREVAALQTERAKVQALEMKLAEIETKIKVWMGVASAISGVLATLISKFF
jgi:outer membrane murein-binding lipoprotein Lpp